MNRPFRTLPATRCAVEHAYATLEKSAAENVFISLLPREEVDLAVDDAFRELPDGPLTGMIVAVKDNIERPGTAHDRGLPRVHL